MTPRERQVAAAILTPGATANRWFQPREVASWREGWRDGTLRRARAASVFAGRPSPMDDDRAEAWAVLDSIRQLDTTTAANVWKRLRVDPCAHGVTPDQATRALLDALFEELTA